MASWPRITCKTEAVCKCGIRPRDGMGQRGCALLCVRARQLGGCRPSAPRDPRVAVLGGGLPPSAGIITHTISFFSQLARGIGGAHDVVLFTTRGGREVVALAGEWPRVDVLRRADGSLGAVMRTSPDSQKIVLYRSLFRGREDAYANGYLRRDGRMGYATFTTVED